MSLRMNALAHMLDWSANHKGEIPAGSNEGPFVSYVLEPAGLSTPQPYCAATQSKAFQLAAQSANVPMPFRYSASARNIFAQGKKNGWEIDKEDIQPGDLIIWRRGTQDSGLGHIEIVHYGLNPNGNIQTVGANHGSVVAEFHYDREHWEHNLIGVIRVPG